MVIIACRFFKAAAVFPVLIGGTCDYSTAIEVIPPGPE
jgi:hypothetical protein